VPKGAPYLAGRATTDDPDRTVPVYFQRVECFGGHHYGIELPGYVPPAAPPTPRGGSGLLYYCPNDECEATSVHVARNVDADCPECGWTLVAGDGRV